MRRCLLSLSVALCACFLAPSGANAAPGDMPTSKPEKIDDIIGDLIVLHDGKGHVFAVVDVFTRNKRRVVFYGSEKKLYMQRTSGSGGDKKKGKRYYYFWGPRERNSNLKRDESGKWVVTCGTRETEFKEADTAFKRKVLDNGKFVSRYWKRRPYALARDEWGTYYYVDRLVDEYGGKAFRLWVGPRGNMVQQRMTNIVSDSEGDIFATKKGALRLILNKKDATWIKNKNRSALTFVPIFPNVKMIYSELGVYAGRLGIPCDDL